MNATKCQTENDGHVVARTDHQAFGEEIGVGMGLRKIEQGYSADKATRQGYGLTENDESSGQQHTWFRKLETQAGRWTSPDPYKGSMNIGDPQSFNRYAYVSGDPVNFIDPSGLLQILICDVTYVWINDRRVPLMSCSNLEMASRSGPYLGGGAGGGRGGGARPEGGASQDSREACRDRVFERFSSPPSVSSSEQTSYNAGLRLAAEKRDSAIRAAGERYTNSLSHLSWTVPTGVLLGGSTPCTVKCAVAGGLIAGGATLTYLENEYNISVNQANRDYQADLRNIRTTHPNAYGRERFYDNRARELRKCDKLPSRSRLPFFSNQQPPVID